MHPVSPVIAGCHQTLIAENQPEYETLPAIVTGDGYVISRWHLSWRERLVVLFNGNIFLSCLTFGRPVQPVILDVEPPRIRVGTYTEDTHA